MYLKLDSMYLKMDCRYLQTIEVLKVLWYGLQIPEKELRWLVSRMETSHLKYSSSAALNHSPYSQNSPSCVYSPSSCGQSPSPVGYISSPGGQSLSQVARVYYNVFQILLHKSGILFHMSGIFLCLYSNCFETFDNELFFNLNYPFNKCN